ncbi:hypothetical protein E6P97_00945 [Patescibacteria group bacterium]|nr:MAG: hypothetical protein E6P97_00945 [Patescibacteria group bacterium]
MFQRLISSVIGDRTDQRKADLYRNLIRREAQIGGTVFGPVPEGVRREFFCLDEHTWVCHEERQDEQGQHQIRTTRYDVRPSGVIKSQNGMYQSLSPEEAQNLRSAVQLYQQRVTEQMYSSVAK